MPPNLNSAVQTLLTEMITECEPIIFNGDGYSAAWHGEAAKRGLLNLKTTIDALPELEGPGVKELFTKYSVLSERELESRYETYLEQYCKTVSVEAKLTVEMAKTLIFPAAIRYQTQLAAACANLAAVGIEFDMDTLEKITELVKGLQDSISRFGKMPGRVERRRASSIMPATIATMCSPRWGSSQVRRFAGRVGCRRFVAVADLPGNVVHQVTAFTSP